MTMMMMTLTMTEMMVMLSRASCSTHSFACAHQTAGALRASQGSSDAIARKGTAGQERVSGENLRSVLWVPCDLMLGGELLPVLRNVLFCR